MMICALIVTLGSVARAEDAAGELRTLQGVWELVSLRTPKITLPDARSLNTQVRIDGDEWTEVIEGTPGLRSKIALGQVRDTKAINLTSRYVDDDNVEINVVRGIYKLDGDLLTVATASANDKKRPETFEVGGSTTVLAIYRRVKTR
jgi:uncharacterized protein (TIGR03067 family)